MQNPPPATPPRKTRADGERNRARLLEAAKHAFATRGAAATFDQIARDAQVGIGTLYRHFPTRDALVEAVYRQETDDLVDHAERLRDHADPVTAVREWMLEFVGYMGAKRGMAEALSTLIGGPDALYSDSSARIIPAFDSLVARAVDAGTIRMVIEPIDLLRALGGVANLSPDDNWKRSATQMVDVLLAGLRT